MDKIRVAVIYGGCSEEHDISVKSAMQLDMALDREKYEVIFLGITRDGRWRLAKPEPDWAAKNSKEDFLSPDKSMKGIITIEADKVKVMPVDVIFPVIHGKMGEDGTLQGLMQMSGNSFIGCDLYASAIAMDKSLTNSCVRQNGILSADFLIANEEILNEPDLLKYPVFVKPARSGSSFGVSKVEKPQDLKRAYDEAIKYDKKVIIEQAIEGVEVSCGVLETEEGLITGEPDMITLESGFFRIHHEKTPENGSENAKIVVPAPLDKETMDRIKKTGKDIFRVLGCHGLARVDMFLQDDGKIVLNEVNTMPGFTSYSRYPRMMKAAGLPMETVVDKLINQALRGVD